MACRAFWGGRMPSRRPADPTARQVPPQPQQQETLPQPNRLSQHQPGAFCGVPRVGEKGKKRGEVDVATDVSSPGTRLSHGDVRKYKDALYYHMVQLKVALPPSTVPPTPP